MTMEQWTEVKITENLRETLSGHRFEHSLGVMREAERIAGKFGLDADKCRLAGLVHDCAREMNVDEMNENPSLHGILGAEIARERYGITDPEVLEAVRAHTTGLPGMGPVAQAVFIADYTEEGRVGEHFDKVRGILENDGLMAAVEAECRMTITHVSSLPGRTLCLDSVMTMNWAVIENKKIRRDVK